MLKMGINIVLLSSLVWVLDIYSSLPPVKDHQLQEQDGESSDDSAVELLRMTEDRDVSNEIEASVYRCFISFNELHEIKSSLEVRI